MDTRAAKRARVLAKRDQGLIPDVLVKSLLFLDVCLLACVVQRVCKAWRHAVECAVQVNVHLVVPRHVVRKEQLVAFRKFALSAKTRTLNAPYGEDQLFSYSALRNLQVAKTCPNLTALDLRATGYCEDFYPWTGDILDCLLKEASMLGSLKRLVIPLLGGWDTMGDRVPPSVQLAHLSEIEMDIPVDDMTKLTRIRPLAPKLTRVRLLLFDIFCHDRRQPALVTALCEMIAGLLTEATQLKSVVIEPGFAVLRCDEITNRLLTRCILTALADRAKLDQLGINFNFLSVPSLRRLCLIETSGTRVHWSGCSINIQECLTRLGFSVPQRVRAVEDQERERSLVSFPFVTRLGSVCHGAPMYIMRDREV